MSIISSPSTALVFSTLNHIYNLNANYQSNNLLPFHNEHLVSLESDRDVSLII